MGEDGVDEGVHPSARVVLSAAGRAEKHSACCVLPPGLQHCMAR